MSRYKFELTLLALVVSLSGSIALTLYSSYYASVGLIVVVFLCVKIVLLHRNSFDKLNFMFRALDAGDYSFSFPEFSRDVKDRSLNELLNRIKLILENARQRSIEREKYYEHIVNSINTGIIIVNDNGNIYQSNTEMRRLVGLEILTHINQIANISDSLAEQIRASEPNKSLQATIKNEWGSTSVSIIASKITLGDKPLKLVAVSDLNNALDQKEFEAWNKLTRVLTHEIMNSLAPITSLSETLMKMNKDPELTHGLSIISKTNKSLMSFVENYRKFSRIQTPQKSPFEIAPLLTSLTKLICPKDVNVDLCIEPADTMIFADENQILQVLVNLLKNAVQAIEHNESKQIRIKVYIRDDESVIVEISNNGPVIDHDVVENLFLPFFTTKPNGKGIGLSISKQIMQLHNGTLRLTANQPNRVMFTLIFR